MQIDRARADRASARRRNPRPPAAREQRAQHHERRAHGLDQIVGRFVRSEGAAHAVRRHDRRSSAPRRPGVRADRSRCARRAGAGRCGSRTGSSVSSAAIRIGSAAFLLPLTVDRAAKRRAAADDHLVHLKMWFPHRAVESRLAPDPRARPARLIAVGFLERQYYRVCAGNARPRTFRASESGWSRVVGRLPRASRAAGELSLNFFVPRPLRADRARRPSDLSPNPLLGQGEGA